jgi:hypothetical protein
MVVLEFRLDALNHRVNVVPNDRAHQVKHLGLLGCGGQV